MSDVRGLSQVQMPVAEEVSGDAYAAIAIGAAMDLVQRERSAIARAADIIVARLQAGGILQCFGTGHSRIPALELCARAGGLAPVGMLSVKDLVMFGREDPASILDATCERDPALGDRVFDLAPIDSHDILLIVSNSGANGSVIQLALRAAENGLPIIAITSAKHTAAVASGHASGRKLSDLADVVIDNGAPLGDAVLPLPSGGMLGGLSSITGVLIVQMLQAEIAKRLIRSGTAVPLLTSQNVPQGDEANRELVAGFAVRVRPIEP